MVPHVRERPVAMHVLPERHRGRGASSSSRPRSTSRTGSSASTVAQARRRRVTHVVANRPETLVYLAGQNVRHAARVALAGGQAREARPPDLRLRPGARALRRGARGRAGARRRCCATLGLAPLRDGHRLARHPRHRAAAAHADVPRGARVRRGDRRAARRGGPEAPHDASGARPSAATASTWTSAATRTPSTRWRPMRCAPSRRRRWRRRCTGRSWATARCGPDRWTIRTLPKRIE